MRTFAEQKEFEREVRRNWLKELVATGMSVTELGRAVGIDRATLWRMARQYGVLLQPERPDNRGALSFSRLNPCVKSGMTRQEISGYLGASVSAVAQAIKRHDLVKAERVAALARAQRKPADQKPEPPKPSPLEQMKLDAVAANKRMRANK